MQARHDNNMITYAVFTTKRNGGFHVLFEGTLSDCEQFEIDFAGCWIDGMRIAPIQTKIGGKWIKDNSMGTWVAVSSLGIT